MFSDIVALMTPCGLSVEAMTEGRIGIMGRLSDLRVGVGEMANKDFALLAFPDFYFSGAEVLQVLAGSYQLEVLPTHWPPREDFDPCFSVYDEDDDWDSVVVPCENESPYSI